MRLQHRQTRRVVSAHQLCPPEDQGLPVQAMRLRGLSERHAQQACEVATQEHGSHVVDAGMKIRRYRSHQQ